MTDYEKFNLVISSLALVVSCGGLALLYYGIRQMDRGGARRAAESERRHEETMRAFAEAGKESKRQHDETMRAFAEEREASQRRHEEAMRRHDETMDSIKQNGAALEAAVKGLQAVIERMETGPGEANRR